MVTTVNDSGDTGRVFVVDPATGGTVGVTTCRRPDRRRGARPGRPRRRLGRRHRRQRRRPRRRSRCTACRSVAATATVDADVVPARLPRRPHDAESLLADPRTGRLYVITKDVFGGAVYAAPRDLTPTGPTGSSRSGRSPAIATDGAFFPDGRHLLVRDYGSGRRLLVPVARAGRRRSTCRARSRARASRSAPDGSGYGARRGCASPVLRIAVPDEITEAMSAHRVGAVRARARRGSDDGTAARDGAAAPTADAPGVGLPDASEPQRSAWPWLAGSCSSASAWSS